ncbi:MAG: M42 family metallopeptidase [Candidatus Methanofastidiosia archaeon]
MLLKELSNARGIAGYENDVRSIIKDNIVDYCEKMRTDAMGNLYATQSGSGPSICLLAHMDEVGMMATAIEGNGIIDFDTVGGIRDNILPGAVVSVGEKRLSGVVGFPPLHLQSKEKKDSPVKKSELRIDCGDIGPEDVQIGDMITFETSFMSQGEIYMGKAFDDRIGCVCLIEMLKAQLGIPITCIFTVQEEIGIRGAMVARTKVKCDYAIACEGTFALDFPGVAEEERMPVMGKGPAITISDNTLIADKRLRESIEAAAHENDIPYQYKKPFAGGTDAGAFHLENGTPSGVIATACRHIHSPCAVASKKDINHTSKLIMAAVLRLAEGV